MLIENYYEEGGKVLRGRRSHEKETVLYPGVYGQCLIYSLREKLPESRSLEIYQRLTGYPVTDDLKHICRKCQTSVLFPAMHTIEHTVQMRYPSIALGDSSDVAGHTMLGHPQTGAPTIFWYDNYQGVQEQPIRYTIRSPSCCKPVRTHSRVVPAARWKAAHTVRRSAVVISAMKR